MPLRGPNRHGVNRHQHECGCGPSAVVRLCPKGDQGGGPKIRPLGP